MEKRTLSFLDQEPPPGYVAGIGRGATGFVTQADLGSSRKVAFSVGEVEKDNVDGQFDDALDDVNDNVNDNVNFKPLKALQDDLDADKVYGDVEKYLQAKRRKKTERNNKGDNEIGSIDTNGLIAKNESVGKTLTEISDQFQDVKADLKSISVEEWENLPESGDFTRRNKRLRDELQQQQRFYRNSDMITIGLKNSGSTEIALDDANEELEEEEVTQKEHDDVKDVDLFELSKAKDILLESQIKSSLKKERDRIDRSEYLKLLEPSNSSAYNIGDFKKARKLFAKMRETNPYKPQNWIGSARLEFEAKKFNRAKQIIQEGCEKCFRNEEIWLVNLEMNQNDKNICKVIVADAIKFNFKSVNLWLKAVEYEQDNLSKIRILRKALELLPKNAELWLNLIKYEDNPDVNERVLQKATEIIPDSIDLWIAYSDILNLKDEKKKSIEVLNDCIEKINPDKRFLIYIEMAKIEESNTMNEIKIDRFVRNAINSISLSNEEWFNQALECETLGCFLTCKSIVLCFLELSTTKRKADCVNDVENINGKSTNDDEVLDSLLERSRQEHENGNFNISDAILTYITNTWSGNSKSWELFFSLKKQRIQSADDKNLYSELFVAYEQCLKSTSYDVSFAIDYADTVIKFSLLENHAVDKDRVRDIIDRALNAHSSPSIQLWMYSIDFEISVESSPAIIRDLFDNFMVSLKTSGSSSQSTEVEVLTKRVIFEKKRGYFDTAAEVSQQMIKSYPDDPCGYINLGKLHERASDWELARKNYISGIKLCSRSAGIYVALSNVYQKGLKNEIKARSVLDEALAKHPDSEDIHHNRIMLEIKLNNPDHAQRLLSKAMTLKPDSPLLWSDKIITSPKNQAKNVYGQALKNTGDHPLVVFAVAQSLWRSGKVEKAMQFFKASLSKDALFGDCYIYYYAMLLKFGSPEQMKELETQITQLKGDQIHGQVWNDRLDTSPPFSKVIDVLRSAALDATKGLI